MVGSFLFVLHSHIPYVRKAGKWPHGEEMLHEIIAETYLPLLNAFSGLYQKKIPISLSLGLTPILLEQLHDPYMQKEFVAYMHARIAAAKKEREIIKQQTPELLDMNEFVLNWYQDRLYEYEHVYQRDIIGSFRFFQDHDGLDILTSAATHGYLPLIKSEDAIWGQLKTAIQQYRTYFGRDPRGIWLPECGYHPGDESLRKGIERFLDSLGIRYFFTDSHVIDAALPYQTKAKPRVKASLTTNSLDVLGLASAQPDEPEVIDVIAREQHSDGSYSTFHPYKVTDTNVHVFGRDRLTGLAVWSATWGYPGEFAYREFHKKSKISGHKYWKITKSGPGLQSKLPYVAVDALNKIQQHSDHFVDLVTDHLRQYKDSQHTLGTVVSSYDTELFGHWWFEGVGWLENVITKFHQRGEVLLVNGSRAVEVHPQIARVKIPESSWGNGGQHATWLNEHTSYMWPIIHECEDRFMNLVQLYPNSKGVEKKLLNQAARELLLLQSSDWPFLVTTFQAKDYAEQRFDEHVLRFNRVCDVIEGKRDFDDVVKDSFTKDNPFKQVDYRDFARGLYSSI